MCRRRFERRETQREEEGELRSGTRSVRARIQTAHAGINLIVDFIANQEPISPITGIPKTIFQNEKKINYSQSETIPEASRGLASEKCYWSQILPECSLTFAGVGRLASSRSATKGPSKSQITVSDRVTSKRTHVQLGAWQTPQWLCNAPLAVVVVVVVVVFVVVVVVVVAVPEPVVGEVVDPMTPILTFENVTDALASLARTSLMSPDVALHDPRVTPGTAGSWSCG